MERCLRMCDCGLDNARLICNVVKPNQYKNIFIMFESRYRKQKIEKKAQREKKARIEKFK
jgi:ribosomal protein S17